ncbi:hypothetical protein [Rhodococcoides kroppenstedtii]|uniref:Uncharacterized protein n=1 Tax=Rhodococcoides kroppenstedtii TaxID=293050 RepID=A0ABS7NNN4_9NOCA|nr:hypothetical protein [Rhodococcus kroppenstedtii]AMY19568.1 hypothetical protein A3Q40_02194 [Rhodococcus sp. PBTS 1]MBY6319601.1 hypothetical protein [Rhodococcus kroppenstedtii]MBY6398284.1 hypothetical protein [Rhodococcus kroppenstedtii]
MSDGVGPEAEVDGIERRWVKACTVWCEMDGAAVVIGLGAGGPAGTRGRQVVFASDSIAAAMADVQFVLGFGPHHTAVTTCSVSSTAHDAELDPWPVLTTELSAVGVRSVYAAPMVGDATRQRCALGSVQLYSARAVVVVPRARALLSLTAHTGFQPPDR